MKSAIPIVLLLAFAGCRKATERVVVACAQDREFAERCFEPFEKATGLVVQPKYDTEANKSVSVAAELMAEQGRPRTDVHWNNEPIATIRLANAGVYAPFPEGVAVKFPPWTRGPNWQAFAARARVLIVNTKLVPEADRPKSLNDLLDPKWKDKLVMAKPLFGTTATQAAAMWSVWGEEKTVAWFHGLKANGITIVPGNKQVAVGVAEGRFAVGMTDTDDAIIELEAKKPVAIIYPDRDAKQDRLGVIFIPNTLALIKGAPNPTGGKKLIETLLTAESEERLANGGGYQIPLNPECETPLHPALVSPFNVKAMPIDWPQAAAVWDRSQAFLKDEFR